MQAIQMLSTVQTNCGMCVSTNGLAETCSRYL